MVGMSGKASEPRSGATGSSKKQQPVQGSHNRTAPPQEALQMARILDDSTRQVSVSELDRLITQVLQVASGRSSEEASIALHDNNFDVEKAVTVLVDSENGGSTGEWTTTGRNRKKRDAPRGTVDSEQIVAPGDTKTTKSRGQGSKGSTSKAAAASTRESYGGGVTVTDGSGRPPPKSGRVPGGQSGKGQDNRGRSQSGRRPMDKSKGLDRERRKEKGGFGGDRGDRSDRDHGDRSERDRGERSDRDHGDRSDRDRGDRSDRDRGDRPDRDRGNRSDRDRGDRSERDRGDRSDRDRGDRSDHPDRWDRSNPADRGGFGDRGGHGDRWERSNRGDRGDRSGRGNRDDRGDRNDRGNRGDRGDRQEGRRERRDRGEDRRNNDDRRGLDERKGDRGDRGSGFNSRKGRQRQRDRTEKFQWDSGSTHPVSGIEPPSKVDPPSSSTTSQFGGNQHKSVAGSAFHQALTTESWDAEVTSPTLQDKDKEQAQPHTWEESRQDDGQSGALFPDALPTSPVTTTSYQSHAQLPALSTPAETTPNLMSVGEGSERALQRAEASEQRRTEPAVVKVSAPVSSSSTTSSASVQAATQKRSKRLARSRIPTKPVEMPGGVDTLDFEFGQFGIDFIGLDPQKEPEATPTSTPPASSEFAQPAERPATYTEVQRLAEDPSIVSIGTHSSPPSQPLPMDLSSPVGVAQSYPAHSTTEQRALVSSTHRSDQGSAAIGSRVETVEASETTLDAPPGLPRPATVPGMESAKSSQSLPSPSQSQQQHQQQQQQQHMALTINTSVSSSSSTAANSAMSSSGGGGLADAARNSAGSVSIQMQTPEPLEMPHQQSSMPSSHPSHSHYQVTSTTSDLLISSVTSAPTSASMPTSVGMTSGSTSTSSSHLRGSGSSQHIGAPHTSISQHSSVHQQQQAPGKQLPTAAANMMYHHTPPLVQYPHPLVMPVYPHNYPDPSEISRQFPVSLPYYNTSSDHSLAPSSTFGSGGAMTDHSKYSRGATSDGSTPVTSQQQQQQHQPQGAQQGSGSGLQQGQHLPAHFMNYYPPFYSHMYHMPHGGFSAPHNMAPKPSGTGSNLSNYQHQHHAAGSSGFGGAGTGSSTSYEDMMSGGGSSGSSSHHDQFSSKMYGSSLSKSTGLPTTGGDVGSGLGGGATSAFTKHYEGSKSMGGSAANSYSYGLGNQYLGYMGGMGMPTMPLPHHIPAATQVMQGGSAHDSTGGGVVTRSGLPSHGSMQKHGGKSMNAYQSSALWSQSAHS